MRVPLSFGFLLLVSCSVPPGFPQSSAAPVVTTPGDGRVAEWMTHRALTRREGDILREMMLGRSNKRIAMELKVAIGTVKTHVKSVLDKLHAASRTEAVAIAQRRGILQDEREYPPSVPGVARIVARPGKRESSGDSKWPRLEHRFTDAVKSGLAP